MRKLYLFFFLFVTLCSSHAQEDPVLDTIAIAKAQIALDEAEILFSKNHINYAKAAIELSSLYMEVPSFVIDWEDLAIESLATIRAEKGTNSPLYQWAVQRLPRTLGQLFDSQLALEEAEATQDSLPALYARRLFERVKCFVEEEDLESYELTTLGMHVLLTLPQAEQEATMAYAKRLISPPRIKIAVKHALMNNALATPTLDSVLLAHALWQYGEAVLEYEQLYPDAYLDIDSVYLRLTQALGIYEQELGLDSDTYKNAYQKLPPKMARYYTLERPYFQHLQQHTTNSDSFIVLFRQVLTQLNEDYVSTYTESELFRWTLRDIKKYHGINDPYYKIVQSIEANWDLDAAEREIAIQKNLVEAYKEEYGRHSHTYLQAVVELGNMYANDGDDIPAEPIFHKAFAQLDLLDERGVIPPTGAGNLLEYYWTLVLPTWRAVLIQEHNLNIIQQTYGLQSVQYWEAYFKLTYTYYKQNILVDGRGKEYLQAGIKNFPKEYLGVVLPILEDLFALDPEFNIYPIVHTLPKRVPIPQLKSLLAFSIDSISRQYAPISTEVAKFIEIFADAYFYDTTKSEYADSSLYYYQKALDIYQKVGDDVAYTTLLDRITQNITQFSPWTTTQVSGFFETLLKIKDEEAEDYELYFLEYVERYASWLYKTEQLIASEQYFERIARYFERENPMYLTGKHQSEANTWYLKTLDRLAGIYRKTGRYYAALDLYEKLIRLSPVLSYNENLGMWNMLRTTNDIGDLMYRMEDYDKALECFEITLKGLDNSENMLDKYQKKATAVLYVRALHNKGRVYFDIEEVNKARLYFNKAFDFVEDSRSPIQMQDVSFLFVDLADLAIYDYEDEQAEQYYTQALTYITDKEERSKIHLAFADFYQLTERDSLAAKHFTQALAIDLKRVQQNYTALSENERLLFLSPILKRFDTFLEFAVSYNHPDLLREAFNNHLIIKGLSLETSNNLQSICNVTEHVELRNKCLEMQRLRKTLSHSTDLPLDTQQSLGKRIEELEEAIGLSSKELRAIYDRNNRNLNFVDLKDLLHNIGTPDSLTAAIDFIVVPENDNIGNEQSIYYAVVVIPHHPYPHFVRLASEAELADVLSPSINAYSFNYITAPSESQYLYNLVWQPLLPYIQNRRFLHLCPTGLLSRIAFGTLQTGGYIHNRVMDKWSLHYYGALRDMLHLKKDTDPSHQTSALLIGGVKFDLTAKELETLLNDRQTLKRDGTGTSKIKVGTRGEEFNFLVGTLDEVTTIRQLFPPDNAVQLLSGIHATEEKLAFFANQSPEILHIATHGYFFPTPPKEKNRKDKQGIEDNIAASTNPLLRSGLALAGINRVWQGGQQIEGMDDGILTALEVSNLDLFNTKLVVLSACETGRGDINNTEGILGLRRAFKLAGAQQLIISLWKVPDAQTAELMKLFYTNYLEGNSVHAAFEYAQKEMRKRYKNPYYWAAFLLIE